MRKFIILAQPRTGSTLLTSLISWNAPKGIRCINEPINPVGHDHHMQPILNPEFKNKHCLFPQSLVQQDIDAALDICYMPIPHTDREDMLHIGWIKQKIDGRIASGFKIMAHHIMALAQEHKFWEYLHRNDIKTIIVKRNNILMQWISDLIVMKTRQCVVWNGEVKQAKVRVPLGQIRKNLDIINEQNEYLQDKTVNLDRKIISYEDFKDNYGFIEDMLPWLIGVRYCVNAKCIKQNPDSLPERVTNYERLCER
jgi:hypothetical protein